MRLSPVGLHETVPVHDQCPMERLLPVRVVGIDVTQRVAVQNLSPVLIDKLLAREGYGLVNG